MSAEASGLIELRLTYGDHGVRFAGPDLLDYAMIFEIIGGDYDGERIRVDSAYHVCCGTLEVNAGLLEKYVQWQNKLGGCNLHNRKGGGNKQLKQLVYDILSLKL